MFEKEANEYAKEVTKKYVFMEHGRARAYWKDGAEFGYNKANEWHYVKDGKYPTDEKDVEVLYQDCNKINVYNCIYDIHAENWLYYNLDNMVLELFPFNVIAWKEIVFPKEDEIESEMFPEIILPEGSSEFIDKVIADAEKRVKEI